MSGYSKLLQYKGKKLQVIVDTVITDRGELVYQAPSVSFHSRHHIQCVQRGADLVIECCTCGRIIVDSETIEESDIE